MGSADRTPREIDTELARLHEEAEGLYNKFDMHVSSAKMMAGAKFYYRGRRRVTDMTLPEAEAILAADLAANADDEYGYTLVRGGCNVGQIRRTVEGLAETRERLTAVRAAAEELNALYTGWSRFFLVTSSKGHIHASMSCSTCRPTTRFGWLPELSGRTEADCVEEFGPALCSVCFPLAPVEWTVAELRKGVR